MQIQYGDNLIEMNEEWSFKNFTNKGDIIEIPNDINVYATCFSHEKPDSGIFSNKMSGVTFYNCNLDNVVIPEGNTVVGGSQRRFKVQNDGNDWIIDGEDKPVEPISTKIFTKKGLPIPVPEDIPLEKVAATIDLIKVAEEKLSESISK